MIRFFRRKKKGALPNLWRNDAEFEKLHAQMKSRTLVTKDRCFALYQWAQYARHLPGECAEVGVYKGGTARLIAQTSPQSKLHLFDTFGGMPQVNATVDLHCAGDFEDTSLDSVRQFLRDCTNIDFHPGVFPQSVRDLEIKSLSFVHVDVDIYQSVMDCLKFFYPKLVRGGVMVFDDYEWKDCPGVKKALEEFLKEKPEKPIVTALYQCMILKI